jgi:hypothetical protein
MCGSFTSLECGMPGVAVELSSTGLSLHLLFSLVLLCTRNSGVAQSSAAAACEQQGMQTLQSNVRTARDLSLGGVSLQASNTQACCCQAAYCFLSSRVHVSFVMYVHTLCSGCVIIIGPSGPAVTTCWRMTTRSCLHSIPLTLLRIPCCLS